MYTNLDADVVANLKKMSDALSKEQLVAELVRKEDKIVGLEKRMEKQIDDSSAIVSRIADVSQTLVKEYRDTKQELDKTKSNMRAIEDKKAAPAVFADTHVLIPGNNKTEILNSVMPTMLPAKVDEIKDVGLLNPKFRSVDVKSFGEEMCIQALISMKKPSGDAQNYKVTVKNRLLSKTKLPWNGTDVLAQLIVEINKKVENVWNKAEGKKRDAADTASDSDNDSGDKKRQRLKLKMEVSEVSTAADPAAGSSSGVQPEDVN